ncbi:MAG: hypothetical protein EXQ52_05100 [Bryobacterales bacterium]|nr:hypothetical protein [Bryobacterales bacterium]
MALTPVVGVMIARRSEPIPCNVSPNPMAWFTVDAPIEKKTTLPRTGVPEETTVGYGVRGVDVPPLVVPEDAHVHVGVALEAGLLECQGRQAGGYPLLAAFLVNVAVISTV